MKPEPNLFPSEVLNFMKGVSFTVGQHLPILKNWACLIKSGVVTSSRNPVVWMGKLDLIREVS